MLCVGRSERRSQVAATVKSVLQDEGEQLLDVLVAKATGAMLADLKIGDSARLAAFVKRLAGAALHGNTSTALATLSVCNRCAPQRHILLPLHVACSPVWYCVTRACVPVSARCAACSVLIVGGEAARPGCHLTLCNPPSRLLRRHNKLRTLLEGDSIGSLGTGAYNPSTSDPCDANALTSAAWELSLLRAHYHPHVAQSAAAIAAIPPGGGAGNLSGVVNTAAGPAQLAESYAYHATGLFRPTPQHRAAPKDAVVAASLRKQRSFGVQQAATLAAYGAGEPVHIRAHSGTQLDATAQRNGASQLEGDSRTDAESAVAAELQNRFRFVLAAACRMSLSTCLGRMMTT